jgi:hypothetical protein
MSRGGKAQRQRSGGGQFENGFHVFGFPRILMMTVYGEASEPRLIAAFICRSAQESRQKL